MTRFCAVRTDFETLNQALRRLERNKAELLLVLEKPWLPLHNNLSERDIREYVKKRKISGSTRSAPGQRCRDTFASLKKTCRKHRISFWDYLKDRVSQTNAILPLPEMIRRAALAQT
ncbi:MAG: transposase [Gammaproteobacteria bacterium]